MLIVPDSRFFKVTCARCEGAETGVRSAREARGIEGGRDRGPDTRQHIRRFDERRKTTARRSAQRKAYQHQSKGDDCDR